jgi:hypothetical protein
LKNKDSIDDKNGIDWHDGMGEIIDSRKHYTWPDQVRAEFYRKINCTLIVRYKRELKEMCNELRENREARLKVLERLEILDLIKPDSEISNDEIRQYRNDLVQRLKSIESYIDACEKLRRFLGKAFLYQTLYLDKYLTTDDYRGLLNISFEDMKLIVRMWEESSEKAQSNWSLIDFIFMRCPWASEVVRLINTVIEDIMAENGYGFQLIKIGFKKEISDEFLKQKSA